MKWQFVFSPAAQKQFRKIDRSAKIAITRYLETRIETAEDPHRFGKSLSGDLGGLWRYRIGDYRLICEIKKHELIVLVLKVGHRRDVYQ